MNTKNSSAVILSESASNSQQGRSTWRLILLKPLVLCLFLFCLSVSTILSVLPAGAQDNQQLTGAWINRSRLHENLGEIKEAIRYLEQAVAQLEDPQGVYLHRLHLAELLAEDGRYPEALEHFRALREDERFRGMLRKRELYWQTLRETGELSATILEMQKQIPGGANGIGPRLEIVEILRFAGRIEDAVAEYDAIVSVAAENGMEHPYRISRARMLEDVGHQERALSEYQSMLADNPHDMMVRERLGRLLCQTGNPEEGTRVLRGLVENRRHSPSAWLQLAKTLQELARFPEATAVLLEGAATTGQDLPFMVELGGAYEIQLQGALAALWYRRAFSTPRSNDAREALRRMVETDPDAVEDVLAELSRPGAESIPVRRDMEEFAIRLALDNGRSREALELAERYAASWNPELLLTVCDVLDTIQERELARRGRQTLQIKFPQTPAGRLARLQLLHPTDLDQPDVLAALPAIQSGGDMPEVLRAAQLQEQAALIRGRAEQALEYRLKALLLQKVPLSAAVEDGLSFAIREGRLDIYKSILDGVPTELPARALLETMLEFFAEPGTGAVNLREAVISNPELYRPETPLSLLFLAVKLDSNVLLDYLAHRSLNQNFVTEKSTPALTAWCLRDRLRQMEQFKESDRRGPEYQKLLSELILTSSPEGALDGWRRLETLRMDNPEMANELSGLFIKAYPDSPMVHLLTRGGEEQ